MNKLQCPWPAKRPSCLFCYPATSRPPPPAYPFNIVQQGDTKEEKKRELKEASTCMLASDDPAHILDKVTADLGESSPERGDHIVTGSLRRRADSSRPSRVWRRGIGRDRIWRVIVVVTRKRLEIVGPQRHSRVRKHASIDIDLASNVFDPRTPLV